MGSEMCIRDRRCNTWYCISEHATGEGGGTVVHWWSRLATLLSVIFQGDCWRLWRGTCGWCRFLISTIDIEPLVVLFGRSFAFAPLHKLVRPFIARVVRMSFDVDKRDRSMTPPTLYLSEQSTIECNCFHI